jgi:hypothetical protein
MSIPDDPYFAGPVAAKVGRLEPPDGRGISIGLWVVVFVLNLVIPLMYGLSAARGDARFGMLLGIAILLALGCWASLASRTIGMALLVGGGIVALSQFLPALQILAGLIAVGAAGIIDGTGGRMAVGSFLGGLVATVVTGGILIGIALALGLPILGMTSWRPSSGGRSRKASSSE